MHDQEWAQLERAIEKINEIAKGFGLDYFQMRFEVCPSQVIYTFGAYGMPARFSHWSFGKNFHRMKTQYDFNLSRIYELVINTDPCYAFLLDGNTLLQNKLVAAHVYAHCDFFKNNARFQHTCRDMMDRMSASAERIRRYELEHGQDRVEAFIDAGLAWCEHIDSNPYLKPSTGNGERSSRNAGPYDSLWELDEREKKAVEEPPKRFPERSQKDVMLFIIENAKHLEPWQRDILSILREEMRYFWPQMETKVMNEGWASYWHLRIMREMDLTPDESIDFAKMHAGVVQPSKSSINPYHVGLAIWEDIEKRWDDPTEEEKQKYGRPGGEGRKKMFEIRETESDISFLRNYLTKELVEKLDLYLYKRVGNQWQVVETDWQKVRDGLCTSMTNCGLPWVEVEDGDYQKNGELYLKHRFEGNELDVPYLERTLVHLYDLWGRTVHLETTLEGKSVLFSYDGEKGGGKKVL